MLKAGDRMYDVLLMVHFLGLAMGVGTSISMLTLGKAAQNLAPEERATFFARVGGLSRNGSIGLALLIASGLGLLFARGASTTFATAGGAFHTKLLLVVVLSGMLGYSQVLRKRLREAGGTGPAAAKLPKLGAGMLLVSLAIIVLAVLAFH